MDLTQCLRVSVIPQPEMAHSVPLLKACFGRQAVFTRWVSLAQYGLFVTLSWSKAVEEGPKAKSILISTYFIPKLNKWRLRDNNSLFSNLTDVIMKSKRALPVLLMHDGLLHLNSLIGCFILLYIHSSQNHLHFHSCFSSEELRLMSKYQFRKHDHRAPVHAVGRSEHPARLDQDASTDVSEGLGGVLGPDLQGSLPRMSPWERLLPSEDPG